MADPAVEQVHFIGKDIVYFHTLFWPAMLQFSGRKTPSQVNVHGFITVSGEKMSKSRGTGIDPLKYLSLGMNPEWLRYYIAAKLNGKVEDVDFNPDDFVARVNADLIGKYVNIASRAVKFVPGGKLVHEPTCERARARAALVDSVKAPVRSPRIRQGPARDHGARRRGEPCASTARRPGSWSRKAGGPRRPQVCSECIEMFKVLTACLKPVLPELALQAEAFLQVPAAGLDERRAAAGRGPPGRRVQAPDAARGREAARRAVRAAGGRARTPALSRSGRGE